METLLTRIGLDFEIRRLMFVLVNVLVPFVSVLSLLLLGVPGSGLHETWVRSHALGLGGTLLCTVGTVVAVVLLRCHFSVSIVGREIYRRIGGEPRAHERLNWTGIFASMYVLALGTTMFGALVIGWAACLSVMAVAILCVGIVLTGVIALRLTHRQVLRHPLGEVCERFGLPESEPDGLAAAHSHSRASLHHTYADLSATVVIALAIYGASLATVGAISRDFVGFHVCTGEISRTLLDARSGIAIYGFVAVMLAQLMIERLRVAREEYATRLITESHASRARGCLGLDAIFLLHLLLGLLAASALLVAGGFFVGTRTAAIAATLYVGFSAFRYVRRTADAVRRYRFANRTRPLGLDPGSSADN